MSECVFCDIAAGRAPASVLSEWGDAVAIEPLNPVTPGHVLVIPRVHAIDATDDPVVTASVMARAAEFAAHWCRIPPPGDERRGCNIITSCGAAATQTVFHLHIHIVPRSPGDGLALPWTPGPDRDQLITALVEHQRVDHVPGTPYVGGCLCGWGQSPEHLGQSWAEHAADAARLAERDDRPRSYHDLLNYDADWEDN